MVSFLKSAAHIDRLPIEKIDPTYKRLRWQVFIGIFFGYAAYYFVRRNYDLAVPGMIELKMYTKAELGVMGTAVGLSYGLSKFLMAAISDRSNPKLFLPLGLLMSGLTMVFMGLVPWATSSIAIMFCLLFINGWFQGMGWPPCGKSMVHWWSKKERGTIVSIWNCAHNVGGGMPGMFLILAGALYFSSTGVEAEAKHIWRQALYYPGIAAVISSFFIYLLMKDTPQSEGLPPIEQYKNEMSADYNEAEVEKELPAKEIFMTYVFRNKLLWYIAIANIFVYLIRYGILSWSPTYLSEVKHFDIKSVSWAYSLYEFAAIPGTLLCGWMSDKVFGGRRGLTGFVFMLMVTIAVTLFWMNPPGNPGIDMAMMIIIGFLIYGPVMLIGLHALELAPKKAAGTAAGFTGLFGYLGGTISASAVVGWAAEHYGWDGGFYVMIGGSVMACVLLFLTMIQEKKHRENLAKEGQEGYKS